MFVSGCNIRVCLVYLLVIRCIMPYVPWLLYDYCQSLSRFSSLVYKTYQVFAGDNAYAQA